MTESIKNKYVYIFIAFLLTLTMMIGCGKVQKTHADTNEMFVKVSESIVHNNGHDKGQVYLDVVYDKDTKVMYTIVSSFTSEGRGSGTSVQMMPIYNQDGSLKTYQN